jgi:hypothetical protein
VVPPAFVRFVRALGGLLKSMGQGALWKVIAHEGNICHDAIAAWRTSVNTEPDGSSLPAASPPSGSTNSVASVAYSVSLPGLLLPDTVTQSSSSTPRCCALKLLRSSTVLHQAAHLYELGDVIGEGSFSHVFAAKRLTPASDEPFNLAVKRFKSTHLSEAVCEAYVLDRCRSHQHIVQLLDVYEGSSKRLHMVFEHAGADLAQMLAPLPTSAQTRSVASHLCGALIHLHSLGLLHTDLKPGNIMVSADASGWRCRLADFGCVIEATGVYNMFFVLVQWLFHDNLFASS